MDKPNPGQTPSRPTGEFPSMRMCPHCDTEMERSIRVCPSCGREQPAEWLTATMYVCLALFVLGVIKILLFG